MCRLLSEVGHEVAVVDNLSTGHRQALKWGTFYEGSIGDKSFLEDVFQKVKPDGVLHFAARSIVSESTADPAQYYWGNVAATLSLLDQVRKQPGCVLVFSSTAATYGVPQTDSISEDHPTEPINPYGRSKLQVEQILQDYWRAYGLASVSFRYFNAAGAEWRSGIGEAHEPETHLIPRLLESALGRVKDVCIYGEDYDTEDGTCIRDYVHVDDLCRAHLAGLEFLRRNAGAFTFNLGNGLGFSVRQVVNVVEEVTGRPLNVKVAARRVGDPPRLIADSTAALRSLGWCPRHTDIRSIVESAWQWHLNRP
jgi:UDP-glucose 4-epimerase